MLHLLYIISSTFYCAIYLIPSRFTTISFLIFSYIIFHVLVGNDGLGKLGPFKVYGWWHWEVNRILHGNLLFASSTPEQPLPRVIAFAPEVNVYSVSEYVSLGSPVHITGRVFLLHVQAQYGSLVVQHYYLFVYSGGGSIVY